MITKRKTFTAGQSVKTTTMLSVYVPSYGVKIYRPGTKAAVAKYDDFLAVYLVSVDDPLWPEGFTVPLRAEAMVSV